MTDEMLYMIGIVGVGFLVNYALRALPFLLFSGRNRELPPWVDRLGKVISPVIIGCLIVYSYSGSAWRTPWPYLAGAVTVALQVWKKNPLVSIVAGTVVYMLLLNCCGCASQRTLELDANHPAVSVTTAGVKFGDEPVKPEEVAEILEDHDVPHDRVIHILLDPNVKNLMPARTLMGLLSRAGYTRSVLVTAEHGTSTNQSGKSYAKEASEGRLDDDFIFYVTPKGVTYGLLTPVGPEDVVKCLANGKARADSLVRICGQEKDYKSPEVMPIMLELEDRLRKAGYVNVRRFWLKSSKPPGEGRRSFDQTIPPERRAPAPSRTVNGIRYKRADE